MKKLTIALLFALAISLIYSHQACAWSPSGHEIVAMIAYDQLSPGAKVKVNAILEAHPRRDKDLLAGMQTSDDRNVTLFIVASTWPDMVRMPTNPSSHTDNHPAWHYVDYPFNMDPNGPAGPQPAEDWDGHSDPQNLLQAMQELVPEFSNAKTPTERQAIDLSWIEHLVGDIHQPLHATSAYSSTFPQGDRGGNSVMIMTTQGQIMNLHAYWDTLEGPDTGIVAIRGAADRIERIHPISEYGDAAKDLDPKAWAKESFDLAKSNVYPGGNLIGIPRSASPDDPPQPPTLTAGYENNAHALAERRIALAGYRLGALVEKLVADLSIPTVNTVPVGSVVPVGTPSISTTQP
jgi:hypothetical protein